MVIKVKQLLFAPLDWGMGHTTRCIPLIKYLQKLGHQVVFAGNEVQCAFIKKCMIVDVIYLEGYNITYGKKRGSFLPHLLLQLPGIVRSMKREHIWLQEQLLLQHYDGIITDNRYGLYTNLVPTVFMTHQLRIRTGMGRVADTLLQRLHYKLLGHFDERWVVDTQGEPNLAGKLSHPTTLPVNTHYIGLLSQLDAPVAGAPVSDTLLILLSGPEPQRTMLVQKLWQQALLYSKPIIFVEGSSNAQRPISIPRHITWYAQLVTSEVQLAMQQSAIVVCRAGYSTIMDLVRLKKKAILIPTPGQPEQEYLAKYLHIKDIFYYCTQKNVNLIDAIEKAQQFPFTCVIRYGAYSEFTAVVDKWLAKL
jgi:UDP-N-acetylglucosamine transferase subunit ALG13